MSKEFVKAVHLIRLPDGMWHDKAFMNYSAAFDEVVRLELNMGIKATIVSRFNKDNLPIGYDMLVLSRYMKCFIDGKEEEQVFDTREIYFTIDELITKSSALKDLKNDLKCDGNPVYFENTITTPEIFSVNGPYYRNFKDVGKIVVYLTKYIVKRINIVDGYK